MYRLTLEVERALKQPYGELLQGTQPSIFDQVRRELERAPMLIAVGDLTSLNLIRANIQPRLCVVDAKTQRNQRIPGMEDTLSEFGYHVVRVSSPPATISDALWAAMDRYIRGGRKVAILVDGEDDLATIPAVLLAPEGAAVCYGQPNRGVVVLWATPEMKEKTKSLLERMEVVEE